MYLNITCCVVANDCNMILHYTVSLLSFTMHCVTQGVIISTHISRTGVIPLFAFKSCHCVKWRQSDGHPTKYTLLWVLIAEMQGYTLIRYMSINIKPPPENLHNIPILSIINLHHSYNIRNQYETQIIYFILLK